ncbi:MAG: fructosamine kinase family protein [Acidimicrobiales bacterium]
MIRDGVAAALAAALGSPVASAVPVAGGSINRAARVTLGDGRPVFVKHSRDAPAGAFAAEAAGLAWIAAAGAVSTPAVLAVGDHADPPFLALEWIDRDPRAGGRGEEFGRALAALHAAGAATFGAAAENWIGPLPQPNAPAATWAEFYGARRLAPLARRAIDCGLLPASFAAAIERLRARLPQLAGPPEPPARLHGDLWSGNAMLDAATGPVVIDPAAYGGHREIDLAMMRLFGGFPAAAFAAYAEAAPLAPGHEERVALWQLYPVLVHVCLFGGGYTRQAQAIVSGYL